ncbi:hypothetical protein FisN_7Hu091 [Fistulifera solaris]|uniref:Uncharacterized protein n=1 Tax=Fistulifera solaris TaxID=1519565 RepID=A0A1Z5K3G5_FISSO|nr:hypothetical protein FisN_7Hu091 [Fistulifera solaris]|eukprot:GAX20780.1 hypothetical protein FisN_7Hu091 [Fistulifera solaris]
MSNENNARCTLLEIIPSSLRRPEQVLPTQFRKDLPTHKLLRKPSLQELEEYGREVMIWHDYENPNEIDVEGSLTLHMHKRATMEMLIMGKSDKAIARTAAYFIELDPLKHKDHFTVWGLKDDGTNFSLVSRNRVFDFREAGPHCFEQWFKAVPIEVPISPRVVHLTNILLSAEQSVVFAKRSDSPYLTFENCAFEDGGTAFLDALETRETTMPSLQFEGSVPLNDDNLIRLLQIDLLEKLVLPSLSSELTFLPFAAQAKFLHYHISSSALLEDPFQSVEIATKKLTLVVVHREESFPTEAMLAFFRRIADLGHFEKLSFGINYDFIWDDWFPDDVPNCVAQGLIQAALANESLKELCIAHLWRTEGPDRGWEPHVGALCNGMKVHKTLCTLNVEVDEEEREEAFGPNYSHLRELLSNNRNITVASVFDEVYGGDDPDIRQLYAVNRFYRRSEGLRTLSPPLRPLLVVDTLLECGFQFSSLLLSFHVDVLCESVQFALSDGSSDETHCPLFRKIPSSLRTPEQVPPPQFGRNFPTHELLHKPTLQELEEYGREVAIWQGCEGSDEADGTGTLTYLVPVVSYSRTIPVVELSLILYMRHQSSRKTWMQMIIIGKSEKVIAQTAAYFMSLNFSKGKEHGEDEGSDLVLRSDERNFDFRAVGLQCLQRRLKTVTPCARVANVENLILSVEQSIVFATQSHTLLFKSCVFEDGGTAFIDALETRKTTMLDLTFIQSLQLNDDNLKRLIQVDSLEYLELPCLEGELTSLPFSAKTKKLRYFISSSALLEDTFQSVHIATRKIVLVLEHNEQSFPTEPMLAFFRRVAALGHLEELAFGVKYDGDGTQIEVPECIVQELIRTALANQYLKELDASHLWAPLGPDWGWDPHIAALFDGLKDHQELRRLRVDAVKGAFGTDYSLLKALLSHNRKITVSNLVNVVFTGDSELDKLNAINRFYRGSEGLGVLSQSTRTLLLTNALLKGASEDFRRSALLLSFHVDLVCEFVQLVLSDGIEESNAGANEDSDVKRRRLM